MICTTLNKIREQGPCVEGWEKLLKHLGKTQADDEPVSLLTILDSNGLDDALWCVCTLPEYDREWRLYAVWCARQRQHLLTDPRSLAALDVAERYANGDATDSELAAAEVAAWEAAEAAWASVWEVTRAAARAAGAAAWVTRPPARAAGVAARAAGASARKAQELRFRAVLAERIANKEEKK